MNIETILLMLAAVVPAAALAWALQGRRLGQRADAAERSAASTRASLDEVQRRLQELQRHQQAAEAARAAAEARSRDLLARLETAQSETRKRQDLLTALQNPLPKADPVVWADTQPFGASSFGPTQPPTTARR